VDPKKLVTLTFPKNVGTSDRIVRLVSGAALAGAGWYFGLSLYAAIPMTVFGLMWMLTGVLSKCSIYYLLGYSTCPIAGDPFAERSQ
jgi:Protein of unknown function (DUF2892)